MRESFCAAAISVLLHLALLSALLSRPGIEAPSPAPMSGILMTFELRDGRGTEHESAPAVAPALESLQGVVVPAPNIQIDAPIDEASLDGEQPSESPSSENPEILAAAADSSFHVPPPPGNAVPTEPREMAMSISQQALLTRWILREIRDFQNADETQASLSFEHEGREYTARLMREPAGDDTGIERVVVDLATEEQGRLWRTRLQVKRLAFSHFTQLVDHWNEEVVLHDDEIMGRFHSNSRIMLGYDRKVAPRLRGKVTTAAPGFSIASASGMRRRHDDIFLGGFEPRTDRIVFPKKWLPFTPDHVNGNASVLPFTRDTRITFYPNGRYGWSEPGSNANERLQTFSSSPAYIVAARGATLYLRGIVSGQVLVYSPERIVIEGDLTCARDPRFTPDSQDFIGLVSDKDIEIAGPRVTGPGDLEIQAAIYARREFAVTYTNARNDGTLIIYGSLSAGSLTETEPRYATRIEFDPRFERLRPPGFPMTDRYEVEAWDGKWRQ